MGLQRRDWGKRNHKMKPNPGNSVSRISGNSYMILHHRHMNDFFSAQTDFFCLFLLAPSVDTRLDDDASSVLPVGGQVLRRLASLHTVPLIRRGSRASSVLSGAPTSRRPCRRAWFPSLGGAVGASDLRSPESRTQDSEAWTVAVRPARADSCSNGDDGNSQVPGEPQLLVCHVLGPRQVRGV